MATTFIILEDGAVFSQASTPSETTLYHLITDGTTTGLAATVLNGSYTTGVTDSSGGSNAIRVTCNSNGAGTQVRLSLNNNKTFNNGVTKFRFKIKSNSWASAQAWVRMQTANTSVASSNSVRIDTGALGSAGVWANRSMTSLGSGWYQYYGECNMTGADVSGDYYIYMGDADADQTITAAADHSFDIWDLKISY